MRAAFMHPRALVSLLACLAVLAACARDRRDDVAVDLTTFPRGFVNAQLQAVRVDEVESRRLLVQDRPGFLDLYVRLPADAEVRWRLPKDVDPKLTPVSLEVDGQAAAAAPTMHDGEWRVDAPARDGDIGKIRLRSMSSRPVAWIEPRVVGRTQRLPPIIPADLRPQAKPVNVILYVVDTLRADRLSLYGYDRPTSPRLEALASRALVFSNAYVAGAYTTPSLSSLFASRFPSELGGRLDPTGPARQTIAELFRAAGYATAGFQANLGLTPSLGYARGFEHYEAPSRDGPVGRRGLDAAGLHAALFSWLRTERGDRPFFAYLQTMDVHFPYDPRPPYSDLFPPRHPPKPPDEAKLREMREKMSDEQIRHALALVTYLDPARYDPCVAYTDHEIGELVDTLESEGLADHTVVVITADHGEPLGDRGELMHGRSLYEEIVRVPLVVLLPGLTHGVRIDDVVSSLDLAPTLADLAGLPVPDQFVGHSWLGSRTAVRPSGAVGELIRNSDYTLTGWYAREGPWKVIVDAAAKPDGYRLFHLPTDPKETTDVSAAHPLVARYLVERATARPPGSTVSTGPVDRGLSDEERRHRNETLRALGYVD